mgnify:CR=1 FL=1
MKHTKKRTEQQRKKWALIGLALFLVATVLICWQVGLPMVRLASDPENFRQWLEERKLGVWGKKREEKPMAWVWGEKSK